MYYLREITWVIDRTLESVGNATTFVEVDSVAERGSIHTLTSVEVDSVVGTLVVSDNCARTFPEVCVGGTASVNSREHVVDVVPRKHLKNELVSDWEPGLVPDSCPRGRV